MQRFVPATMNTMLRMHRGVSGLPGRCDSPAARDSAASTGARLRSSPPRALGQHAPELESISANVVRVAVLGDLHLKDELMAPFMAAREHVQEAVRGSKGSDSESAGYLVQLGDLGTGPTSGSPAAFSYAASYLQSFGIPFNLILGNHDLEGVEFDSDPANLAAWEESFQQSHHWVKDVGPCVMIGLSTTRYRSNVLSHHEVHIDPEQLEWFETQLKTFSADKPVIVFTHAPPLGCGLKVLHGLHVKNRCAWLNHSTNPKAFLDLVQRYPRVQLWLSGHFHLSHDYADSISSSSGCLFVQTGVIGEHTNRDGSRQSRFLTLTPTHCQVSTIDHEDGGAMREDLRFEWNRVDAVELQVSEDDLLCDPSAGYVCAPTGCALFEDDGNRWYPVGPGTLLGCHDGMLLEYDLATFAPVGCVTLNTEGCAVRLLDASGSDVTDATDTDGSNVTRIELVHSDGQLHEHFERNPWGTFFGVFQSNRWPEKRRKFLESRESLEPETIMT